MEATPRAHGLTPHDIHGEIRHQHHGIRELLGRALGHAAAVLRTGDASDGDSLRALVRDLLLVLGLHMQFEERTLVPILRAEHILAEHARQWRVLETMESELGAPGEPRHLALLVQSFVADVLRDMDDEEREMSALCPV
jgi:hypothetical protein